MEAVGGVDGGESAEEASAVEIGTASATSSSRRQERIVESVVYQLVRVEGDGRLVPATDAEVMQVENMLQDCENELPEVEGKSEQKFGIISQKRYPLIEKRCPMIEESVDKLSPGNSSSPGARAANAVTLSEPAVSDQNASRALDSNIASSSKPDFSLLKEEICLDDLTIRELQETFRAAFGRETSVKDKLWLKRRITMGLTNSCDVPTTSFILKEKKIFQKETIEEAQPQSERRKCRPVPRSVDHKKSLARHGRQEEEQLLCGSTPELDGVAKGEVVDMEQSGTKRLRKPTKRYIEELSELDTRDCSLGLVSSVKSSLHGHLSPEPRIKQIHNNVGSSVLVTRLDSLGGSIVQIPFVSRERRRRPRKDFLTLVDGPATISDKSVRESYYLKEHDRKKENADPAIAGCHSDDNLDTMPTLKGGTKRKHHRAWTLNEVMKLVEGVSRYGAGRWSQIKRLAFASYSHRTSVDLKDKWRNLLKASFSQGPIEKESRRHTNSVPVPAPILVRVRELAKLQRQPGIEFGAGKFTDHAEETVHGGGPGFL